MLNNNAIHNFPHREIYFNKSLSNFWHTHRIVTTNQYAYIYVQSGSKSIKNCDLLGNLFKDELILDK